MRSLARPRFTLRRHHTPPPAAVDRQRQMPSRRLNPVTDGAMEFSRSTSATNTSARHVHQLNSSTSANRIRDPSLDSRGTSMRSNFRSTVRSSDPAPPDGHNRRPHPTAPGSVSPTVSADGPRPTAPDRVSPTVLTSGLGQRSQPVVPTGGRSWRPQPAVPGSISPTVLTYGPHLRSSPAVPAGGPSRWSQPVVPAGGPSRWPQPVAPAGGPSRWSQPVVPCSVSPTVSADGPGQHLAYGPHQRS